MKKPSLALIPSGYKAGKVYSILPNNGVGDFTFTRNSVATRVNKDGLIEEVAIDTPRLDYSDSNCPSLLLEPQKTNLVPYSEDFSQANWVKLNSINEINQTISPDGTLNSNKVTQSGGTAEHSIYNTISIVSGTTYTISIFVKYIDWQYFQVRARFGGFGEEIGIIYDAINKTKTAEKGSLVSYKIEEYPNDWVRVSITAQAISNSTAGGFVLAFNNSQSIFNDVNVPNTGKSVYAWGAQTEEGSYPTSYIPTEASTATRDNDFISGAGNANLFNSLDGTFFVQMASFLNTQTNSNGIELSDSSGQNRVTIQYDTTNNQIRAEIKVANVTEALFFTSTYDVTNFNKIAVTYKYNEAKLYINGNLISTDTNVNIFAEDTLTEVRSTIAGISSGAFNLQAKIKDLRVYDKALTDAELIELTSN